MRKVRIQISDQLFEELSAFVRQREWFLAEGFRRGAELLLQVYHASPSKPLAVWTPPASICAGWNGMNDAQLRDALFAGGDIHLP